MVTKIYKFVLTFKITVELCTNSLSTFYVYRMLLRKVIIIKGFTILLNTVKSKWTYKY